MLVKHLTCCFILFTCLLNNIYGQSIAISKPTLGFSFLCQSVNVNTNHSISFTVSPIANLQANNQFSLEMSNDDFSSNIISISPVTVTQGGTASQFIMNFTLPNTTYGTNYKLRVKSSAPAATSIKTDPFDAYFMLHNQEINLNIPNGVDNVTYCTGSSYTLFIYDSGNSNTPLYYPSLTYTWRKIQGTGDVVVGSGPTLSVNQPGQYFVETNYGVCTPSSQSRSRLVTVSQASAAAVTISATPQTNTICEGTPITLSLDITNPTGYTIQWFLNQNPINGAIGTTLQAVSAGSYKATINNGSCVIETTPFVLNAETFNVNLNITSPYELTYGETIAVEVNTDANSPTFEWFNNASLLSESSNILSISESGQYIVKVTQNSGCITTVEIPFIIQDPSVDNITNVISPNGDGINDKFKLPNELINSNNVKLEILNSSGKSVLSTDNYQNNWPESADDILKSSAFFFYVVTKDNKVVKQGVLTIIR